MREVKFRAWDSKLKFMNVDVEFTGKLNEIFRVEPHMSYMQYTGLKDKNGVEIYEGDICKVRDKQEVIEWDSHYACFNTPMLPNKYVEVIGNIYENKELI